MAEEKWRPDGVGEKAVTGWNKWLLPAPVLLAGIVWLGFRPTGDGDFPLAWVSGMFLFLTIELTTYLSLRMRYRGRSEPVAYHRNYIPAMKLTLAGMLCLVGLIQLVQLTQETSAGMLIAAVGIPAVLLGATIGLLVTPEPTPD